MIFKTLINFPIVKFIQGLSTFGGLIDEDDFHFACITRLIEFISFEYLNLLIAGGHGLIYHHDARRITEIEGFEGGGESEHTDYSGWIGTVTTGGGAGYEEWVSGYYESLVKSTSMCGFDSVICLSAESIEAHFIRLIKDEKCVDSLVKVALEGITASFGGLRVKLLSKAKALVSVVIHAGEICLLDSKRTPIKK